MKSLFALPLLLLHAAPALADSKLPPARYANVAIADPAKEADRKSVV